MPRRYDVSLLDKIRQGQYETDYEGVPGFWSSPYPRAEMTARLIPDCISPCALCRC